MMTACLMLLSLLGSPAAATSSLGDLVVGGTVTIQGSAFSVGGSTFIVKEGTVTVGGLLQVGSISFAAGAIHNSSETLITEVLDVTSTAFSTCYATVTISASGSAPIRVYFSGTIGEASGGTGALSFLENGSFVTPFSQTKAVARYYVGSGNTEVIAHWERKIRAPAAGVKSYCLLAKDLGGGALDIYNGPSNSSVFGVEEVK